MSGERKQEDAVKYKVVLGFILLGVPLACGQGVKPAGGFVPDSKTAVKIAEAVLVPVYGEKQVESEKPFTAKLKGDVWTVQGTLTCSDGKGGSTTSCAGGVAVVEISKTDGHVISVAHFK
jgi:hypothetical protein